MHVPEGWDSGKFSQFIDKIYGGGTPSRDQPKYWNGTIPWVTVKDLTAQQIHGAQEYITEAGLKESASNIVSAGTVIIATRMAVGKAVISTCDVAINQDLKAILTGKHTDSVYLYYWMLNNSRKIERMGNGSTVKGVQVSDIKSLYMAIPRSIKEQQQIAQILSTWDKAIEKLDALIAAKQKRKKALMQQLLTGKKRFAEFDGEWKLCYLGDVSTFKGGSAFKENYQGEIKGEIPFIKVSDMNLPDNSVFINNANNWVSVEVAEKLKAKPFPKGAIVFAKVGAALLLNRRRILARDTIIDNNMMAAIPTENSDTSFLYQLMLVIDFAKLVQGGAVPSITQFDLSRLKIKIPEIKEQQKIALVLSVADKEIETHQKQLSALKQQKKSLMQQLLTGKKRVKLDEPEQLVAVGA